MAVRGSLATRTPPPLWSDGIHYVRRASKGDEHLMKWVVAAHRTTASPLKRRAGSLDEALTLALRATKAWLKEHPADKRLHSSSPLPAASGLQGAKRQRGPKPKAIAAVPFSTYHFDCIRANPYAQVWQCVSYPGEKKPVGRKRNDGGAPEQTAFRHQKGECAVLMGETPVCEADGSVRVFPLWQEADEFAEGLYAAAPEDEIIGWKPGEQCVNATQFHKVMFDPEVWGTAKRPFYLWNVSHGKFIYRDITKPAIAADARAARSTRHLQETNPELYLQVQEARAKQRSLDRVAAFSDEPLLFRSIWEATKEAYRRDAMMRGEVV